MTTEEERTVMCEELYAALREIVSQVDQGGSDGKVFARDYCVERARSLVDKYSDKKPIPVDAWQVDTLEVVHQGNVPDWVVEAIDKQDVRLTPDRHHLVILTLEGEMVVDDGDYLIRGPLGEYWFNRRDILEKMYEKVRDDV